MSSATTAAEGDDDEVVHDFAPLLLVYKSGRLERPLAMPPIPPGRDAATGVVSKDVALSPHSFVRLYLPPAAATAERKLPVVVYFHGGGFVIGSAGSAAYHRCLNDLAAACPAVAVSVDYRLAPEHPVPAAYEDSLAALKWALSSSSVAEAEADPWLAAHGDPARVFLAGDSAGGNICHHLAMHPDIRDDADGDDLSLGSSAGFGARCMVDVFNFLCSLLVNARDMVITPDGQGAFTSEEDVMLFSLVLVNSAVELGGEAIGKKLMRLILDDLFFRLIHYTTE